MKKTIDITPRTEYATVLNTCQLLSASGQLGVSDTPASPSYPGGGD